MSTKYYLQKVPVESVEPGFSLAVGNDGTYRLFEVERIHVSERSGQPVLVRLTSKTASDAVLEYELGTPVVRLFGICEAAAS